MDKKDAERFKNLMEGMADNFRDTISKPGLILRWEILKKYTIDQVERAGFEIIKRRKYTKMPPIAEFIEVIEGEAPQLDLIAENQWSTVVGYIRKIGSYGTPIFQDPITRHLFQTRFRFGEICRESVRDLGFIRREFIAAYCYEKKYSMIPMIDCRGPEGNQEKIGANPCQ